MKDLDIRIDPPIGLPVADQAEFIVLPLIEATIVLLIAPRPTSIRAQAAGSGTAVTERMLAV